MKLNWKIVLLVISLMILISGIFGISLMAHSRWAHFEGTPDGWLSYWGGIFGSGIGVIGALLVLREQINFEKVDNTFFNLLTIHNDIISNIRVPDKFGNSIFDVVYLGMVKNNISLIKQNEINSQIKFFIMYKKCYVYYIQKLKDTISESISSFKSEPDYIFVKYQVDDLEYNLPILCNKFVNVVDYNNFYEAITILNKIYDNVFNSNIYSKIHKDNNEIINQFRLLYNQMNKIIPPDLSREQRKTIVESSLREHYGIIGNYFRTFHRIIKFVNENVKDGTTKANYIGFIRAMINEREMLVIYYNAFYTNRGKGLGEQLIFTNFFGTLNDLPIEDTEDAQHFNKNSLLWGKYDIEVMRGCTSKDVSHG